MGDLAIVTTLKPKEGGSTIKCPMLTSSNYIVWGIRMKNVLKVHKVWNIVETESEEEEKNDLAIGLMFQAIPGTLVLQVGELNTAKKVWEAIRMRHVGAERVKEARLQTLMFEFDRLSMKDAEKIDDFAGRLSEISSKAAVLGEEIEESKLVKKFLKILPRKKYIHIVASLEQVLDLKTTSFEDIVGRLKVYEERGPKKKRHTKIMGNSCTQILSLHVSTMMNTKETEDGVEGPIEEEAVDVAMEAETHQG